MAEEKVKEQSKFTLPPVIPVILSYSDPSYYGTDIGYGDDGVYSGEDKSKYSQCEDIAAEKEDVMEAIDKVRNSFEADDYRLYPQRLKGGNNCQDFVEIIRINLQ